MVTSHRPIYAETNLNIYFRDVKSKWMPVCGFNLRIVVKQKRKRSCCTCTNKNSRKNNGHINLS